MNFKARFIADQWDAMKKLEADMKDSIRHTRRQLKEESLRSLARACDGMARSERLELATELYWLCPQIPSEICIKPLGFEFPTGLPKFGIPMMESGRFCKNCGMRLFSNSRTQQYAECLQCSRVDLSERFLVRVRDGAIEWVQ